VTWALVVGGGTAGHVVPALAVARELVSRGHDASDIRFVGSRRGMEARMVPEAGFEIDLLPGRGLNERKLNLSNLASAAALAGAGAKALSLVARHRPAVVFGVGGYASMAPSVAAGILRRPLVLHEQNARPGAANRLAARFASACAVSLPGTRLPKAVHTGNPLSTAFVGIVRSDETRAAARARLAIPEGATVLAAWGGSLGARSVNLAVKHMVENWDGQPGLFVHHVIGRRDFPTWQDPQTGVGIEYRSVEYEDSMADVMLAADFAVCRAGGSNVAELAATGLPALLVPLPIATEDHQTANARSLVDAGGALLVPDHELDGERLAAVAVPLLGDRSRLEAMSAAVSGLARPDAASRVADLVEKYAR
jgi:UDP-N-acetylglucosamine--N-acetylmuramyl-(pentapeptide) pyrophosphoryl-undecaprenol N-acetylglucosamine transferase